MKNLTALANTFLLHADEPFLTLSEGLIKVRLIEAALSLGWTIQEGSAAGGVDTASVSNGKLSWINHCRALYYPNSVTTVTIERPFRLAIEIKSRSDHGSKNVSRFEHMYADIEQTSRDPLRAFLFIFDLGIYRSFSGDKTSKRGRPSKHGDFFLTYFPPALSLSDSWRAIQTSINLQIFARTFPCTALNTQRIIVVGAQVLQEELST